MNKTTNENKKSYKKPLVLGAIAVLLTLIGVTGGNTYAKYVTSKTVDTTSATVAKWGYVISADAADLFEKKYADDANTTENVMVANTTGDKTNTGIYTHGTTDVVAPGSKGSTTITVSGVAEVAAKLTVSVTIDSEVSYGTYKLVKWTLTGGDKTWTLNSSNEFVYDTNKNTFAIDADSDLSGDKAMEFVLSWEWAFEGTEENANAYDTLLGYKANGVAKDDPSIKDLPGYASANYDAATTEVGISMVVTIEQVAK